MIELTESFRVVDANDQTLGYVYFEDEDGRRKVMNQLMRDEARRIAATLRSCRAYWLGPTESNMLKVARSCQAARGNPYECPLSGRTGHAGIAGMT